MRFLYAILAVAVMALPACGKKEEAPKPAAAPAGVTVSGMNLGKAIGADKKISAATDVFGKADTFYASIDTTGAGSATLKAKWTYHRGDKVALVKEDTQTIAPTGPARSEFHVSKSDGWPLGDYQVEVFLGDKSAGVMKFAVK
jgi:hypothetical protein